MLGAALAKEGIKISQANWLAPSTQPQEGRQDEEGTQATGRCTGAGSHRHADQAQRHDHPGADQEGRQHDQDARRLPAYDRGPGGHQGNGRREEVSGPGRGDDGDCDGRHSVLSCRLSSATCPNRPESRRHDAVGVMSDKEKKPFVGLAGAGLPRLKQVVVLAGAVA